MSGHNTKWAKLWKMEIQLLGHCPITSTCREYMENKTYIKLNACYNRNTIDVYHKGAVRYYSCKALIRKRYEDKMVFGYTKLVNNGHTLCMVPAADPWPMEPDK